MSDITINMCTSGGAAQVRTPAGKRKRIKKRFRKKMQPAGKMQAIKKTFQKKMQHLEQKGYVEGKQKSNHRMGQSRPDQAPPLPNGASTKHPSLPTSTHSKGLPRPCSTASAPHCSSEPSTSTRSLPSPAAAVNSKDRHEKPKGPVITKSTTTSLRPSVPSSSHKPTAWQTVAGIPAKYLAIDCEMVGTGPKGSISQLARCSIVSYEGDVVYDKFIIPPVPVTDYRTRWSGIRCRDLANATPYVEARKEILRLLMGKMVIGHAIHNDFQVLGYSHPGAFTRDTSRISLLNLKAGFAENECASLKRLTKAIFNRDIQTGRKGHSSVEDARATMELYKVVEAEWERKLASDPQAR